MDAINDGLFNQAYSASVYVNKFLKKYEMSKLLNEPYEREGACITIESGHEGIHDEVFDYLIGLKHILFAFPAVTVAPL